VPFAVVNVDSKVRSVAFEGDRAFASFHNNAVKIYLLSEGGV